MGPDSPWARFTEFRRWLGQCKCLDNLKERFSAPVRDQRVVTTTGGHRQRNAAGTGVSARRSPAAHHRACGASPKARGARAMSLVDDLSKIGSIDQLPHLFRCSLTRRVNASGSLLFFNQLSHQSPVFVRKDLLGSKGRSRSFCRRFTVDFSPELLVEHRVATQ